MKRKRRAVFRHAAAKPFGLAWLKPVLGWSRVRPDVSRLLFFALVSREGKRSPSALG
jgi:hypothetical protein